MCAMPLDCGSPSTPLGAVVASGQVGQVRLVGDPALRRPAPAVVKFDRVLRDRVAGLLGRLRQMGGTAVAAPVVGLDLAVVVTCRRGLPAVLVNPVLYEVVSAETFAWESCLSAPGQRWWVPRSAGAVVIASDPAGSRVHLSATGQSARVLQHAVEHLRGRLPADRAAAEAAGGG